MHLMMCTTVTVAMGNLCVHKHISAGSVGIIPVHKAFGSTHIISLCSVFTHLYCTNFSSITLERL